MIVLFVIILMIFLGILGSKDDNDQNNTDESAAATFKSNKQDDIKFDDKKINVYVFWGNGCPHCEDLYTFFNNLDAKYKAYFNIYSFEVWDNTENNKFMKEMASKLNEEVSGVPYTIIGNKSYSGYNESLGKTIKKAILEEYKNKGKNDIYKNWK